MRGVKYRAWYNGKMYEVAKLDLWGDPDQATCDLASLDFDEEELFDIYLHEVKLMQFTGLHDKNGKEIYEGDILRLHNGKIRTVFRVKGGFAIESLDMDVGKYGKIFCCPIDSLADEQDAGYIEDQSEEIGNIDNNPELLESEE